MPENIAQYAATHFAGQVRSHVDEVLSRHGSLDAEVTLDLAGGQKAMIRPGEFAKFSGISSEDQIGIGKWGNGTHIFDVKNGELYDLSGTPEDPTVVRVPIVAGHRYRTRESAVGEWMYGSNGQQAAFGDSMRERTEGMEAGTLSPEATKELLARLEAKGINALEYLVVPEEVSE